MSNAALCIQLPVLVKARSQDGHRILEVESSNECVDLEGDVILQSALLGSADHFLSKGHIDVDHVSEIGGRYGITNLSEWIVGKPIEVKDLGGGRTSTVLELVQSGPGLAKADEIWAGLQRDPPVPWRASIYGFPRGDGFFDARVEKCAEAPTAKRYVVKSMEWRSLALTMRPVNDAITGSASIVTAKAFAAGVEVIKASAAYAQEASAALPPCVPAPGDFLLAPRNRIEMLGHYTHYIANGRSPYAGPNSPLGEVGSGRSIAAFRDHFMFTCCLDCDTADLMALAMMQLLKRENLTGPL